MATRMKQRRGTASQWISTNSGNGPILEAGEIGFESDTNKFKIGDGVNHWVNLTYFTDAASITTAINNIIDGAPAALNTLNELAAALGDDANFLASLATESYVDTAVSNSTFDASLAAGAGIDWNASTDQFDIDNTIATTSYVDTEIDSHVNATTSVHGIADVAELSTKTYADNAASSEVSTHNSDTTDVHGIADTSLLSTKSYAETQVSTHNSDTTSVHGIADTTVLVTTTDLSTAVSDHNLDTTNVHGIIDTAELATQSYADSAVSTHSSDTTSVHGIADTTVLVTATDLSTSVSNHNSDTTNVHGITDTSVLATSSDVSTAVSDHNSDTTNVHGISDTADLATKSYADTAEADAITAAGTAADTKIADAVAALTKSSVGLGNVDNTSDANKPISTATQTALDAKASLSGATFTANVEIDGNLVVDGNLTINGTEFIASATSITIEDNLLQLSHENPANTVDLGLVVAYNDGAAKHAGIARDVSDDKWKLFKGVSTEPTTTVAFGEGSLDALAVGALEATTVTPSSGVVFSDGTQTKEGVASRTPIIQKTASYTLSALTERDSLIEVSSSSATTVTIPTNATVAYPVGTSIDILQTSTGQVTIAGSGGVTVNGTPGLKLRTQWSSATLFKRAENTWVVMGDLSA